MGAPHRLFVYGSLMNGMEASELLSRRARFLSRGAIRGQLYDLGPYPGAIRSNSPNEHVTGELYELRDTRVIEEIDEYEDYDPSNPDSLFTRELVTVRLSGHERRAVKAWTYFYNPKRSLKGAKKIVSGDYRLAQAG